MTNLSTLIHAATGQTLSATDDIWRCYGAKRHWNTMRCHSTPHRTIADMRVGRSVLMRQFSSQQTDFCAGRVQSVTRKPRFKRACGIRLSAKARRDHRPDFAAAPPQLRRQGELFQSVVQCLQDH